MPQLTKPLPLGALTLVAAFGLIGCTTLGAMIGAPGPTFEGCNPQVPLSYRIQTEIPVGTLEIRVLDATGSPMASASVMASRLVYTGAKCISMIDATTDEQGVARLERMKTGPYQVSLGNFSATASATVEADQTTSVTLRKPS
ncbi:MAG TPA: carboxypeptidase-like regulatory domain-containing protein [Stenomitos sp.]